jgi:penicillin-binding protein 2
MEKASSRLRVLAMLVALMFVSLSVRLWYLQVLAAPAYEKAAHANFIRFAYTDPLRGQIYDDTGKRLVRNRLSLEVRVSPQQMGDRSEEVVQRLADLLKIPVADIVRSLQNKQYSPYQSIPIAEFVSKDVDFYIAEHQDEFPGVTVEKTSVRGYPYGSTAAQILGYTGLITAQEYKDLKSKGYGQNDIVGRSGLEAEYERYLRGQKGVQKFVVDSNNQTVQALAAIPPTKGDDLRLTLDLKDQQAAEAALREGMLRARSMTDSSGVPLHANAGVVIVMDANTGAIKAMASLPSYDPNWFVQGLTKRQANYVFRSKAAPSLNRAVQLGYVPGSTFKPITALSAMDAGIASPYGSYLCSTDYTSPNDKSGTVFTNWEPSNTYMSIATALQDSCDTVFYRFGSAFYQLYVDNQLSSDGQVFQDELRRWGFGTPTGVDLPAEAAGLVPDAKWAAANPQQFPYGFVPGIDILTAIGSTYISATPLQMAQAYAAIANGGHLCRPHVVSKIVNAQGRTVKQVGSHCGQTLPYTQSQLQYVRNALASVVASGTASCPFLGFPLSQVPVAGKTGTAERQGFQDTSWFAAMVGPTAHPNYVVITMVEQGGFGSQVAAPITRDVIERIEGLTNTPKPGCYTPGSR